MISTHRWLRSSIVAASVSAALGTSPVVIAKSLTVTGDIQTRSPTAIYIANKPTIEAFVESTSIVIKEGNNSGCTLTTQQQIAMDAKNDDELTCLFDFTPPFAMIKTPAEAGSEWLLTGIIDQIGAVNVPITSTFFSGSANTPVVIPTANVVINTIAPIPLNVTNIDYRSKFSKGNGDVFEINSPQDSNRIVVELNTEAKDYDRVLTLDGYGSCGITSGKTEPCSLDLGEYEFGNDNNRLGETVIPVRADAHNDYFHTNELAPEKSITIKWDSRLAEYIQMASSDNPDKNSVTLDDGTVITADEDSWVIALKTPHYARTDDWWHLTGRGRLKPSGVEHEEVPKVVINSVDYSYLWKSRTGPSSGVINPIKTEYVGEYVLLTYDVSDVSSADYIVDFEFADKLDNKISITEESIIENIDIEFLPFTAGKLTSDKAYAAYFPNDLQFAMYSRFRDLTIQSVTIDGTPVTHGDVTGEGAHFKVTSFPKDFVSGSKANLNVTVVDSKNEIHSFDMEFIIQPFDMTARYDEAYDEIQEYAVDLRQSNTVSGSRDCKLYDNEEDAKKGKFEFSSELHCYLSWENLPTEMEVESMYSKYLVNGFTDKSNPEYNYRVKFFDSQGNESTSDLKALNLISLEVPEISLEIENGDIIEGDAMQAFASPVAGGRVAEIRAKMVNGAGKIVATNPFGDDSITILKQSGTSTTVEPRSLIRVYTDPGALWSSADLTVKAGYDRTTKHDKTEQIRMVYVPDENVTAVIDMVDFDIVNSMPHDIKAGIGVLDKKTKEYVYDVNTHGEWDVTLQQYVGNKEYTDVQTSKGLDLNGSVTFTVDPTGLVGAESYRYRIVADIVSKYPGYARQIISRDQTFKVHKGGPIDGFIDSSALQKTVPFKYRGSLEFDTKADKKAYGNVTWHYRNIDSGSWIEIKAENPERFEYTFVDTGTYEVRSTVENKYTGTTSEILSEFILAYDEVEAEMLYNGTEYVNQVNTVTLDVPNAASDYDVEWSEDKCETFTSGTLSHSFTRSEAVKVDVCARIAFKGSEQAGSKRWTVIKKKITVKDPYPLKVKVKTSKTSEVGFPSTLTSTVQTDSYIGHSVEASWYRPDGTIIPSTLVKVSNNKYELTATHIVTQDDLDSFKTTKVFYVEAVLPKVEESRSRVDAKMSVLAYEFPHFEMKVDQDYIFAPTEADVFIKMVEEPEVDMTFTYDWLTRDGSKLDSTRDSRTGSRAKYDINDAGLNEFAVLITDERNNSYLYTSTSVAEIADPAVITLKTSFSNDELRYPVDLSVRPSVDYEHNDDKTLISEYFVNDELVLTGVNGTKLYYTAETAGDYTVKYKTQSKLGAMDETEFSFTVVPNQRPECTIKTSEASSTYNFKADCVDHDGKVRAYLIEFLELGLSGSSKEYRLTKNATELVGRTSFTVRLTATDDSLEDTVVETVQLISPPEDK